MVAQPRGPPPERDRAASGKVGARKHETSLPGRHDTAASNADRLWRWTCTTQDGVGFYQATQRAGRRWSTAERQPAAGHRPGQPDGGDRRPGHRGADRGRAGRRGPLPAGRRRARGPRRPSARRAASSPPATLRRIRGPHDHTHDPHPGQLPRNSQPTGGRRPASRTAGRPCGPGPGSATRSSCTGGRRPTGPRPTSRDAGPAGRPPVGHSRRQDYPAWPWPWSGWK
jgi:hypothetical protein